MTTMIAIFTTVVALLGVASPALAQSQGPAGGVIDILGEVFGLKHDLRGHVVQHREATLVLRADNGHVYTINTAALDTGALGRLKEGAPVTVSLKAAGPDDSSMPIASAITAVANQPAKVFRRVEGTVESVNGDRIVFKTRDGMTVTLDRARIVGEVAQLAAHEPATLVYEQEPQLAGVWIETREGVAPSASPDTGPYQRVHGYVQSVTSGALTLKTAEGRVVTVDTSQVPDKIAVRTGDIVSVVGKPAVDGDRDRLVAELIQSDGAPAPARPSR